MKFTAFEVPANQTSIFSPIGKMLPSVSWRIETLQWNPLWIIIGPETRVPMQHWATECALRDRYDVLANRELVPTAVQVDNGYATLTIVIIANANKSSSQQQLTAAPTLLTPMEANALRRLLRKSFPRVDLSEERVLAVRAMLQSSFGIDP